MTDNDKRLLAGVQGQGAQILESFSLQYLKPKFFGMGSPLITGDLNENFDSGQFVEDKADYTTIFGTPMWQYLKIFAGSYIIPSLTNIPLLNTSQDYPGLEIHTVLVEVSQSKNIVKTAIQGANGTVKEYISDGDYEFTIKGCLAKSPISQEYPAQEVENFIKIMQVPESIQVSAPLINKFASHIVIESYQLMENEGLRNLQFFEIKACSDFPIVLVNNNQL